ncbi:MAG: DUF4124 domain-containing protein [Proteobacteria bacterium]|nr:DUF4124 domain-containing protein [Pseudomonadota bacterium]
MAVLATLAAAGLACAAALAGNGTTTVYKWIDARGVVHYSDQPHAHAQKLEIQGAQTFAAPPTPPTSSEYAPQGTQAPSAAYRTCEIAQPGDQQMLMNVYRATVVVRTSPPLRQGDDIRLFVDGKQVPGSGTTYTVPVFRGQHSAQAMIEDSTGQIICETSTITFYVHQPSIQNPHNPVRPH